MLDFIDNNAYEIMAVIAFLVLMLAIYWGELFVIQYQDFEEQEKRINAKFDKNIADEYRKLYEAARKQL